MTFLPRADGFDWRNFGVRAASGLVLASATLWAVLLFHGPPGLAGAPYLTMIAVAGALLSFEWSAMASPAHARGAAFLTTLAVVAVVLLAYEGRYTQAWVGVALGAAVVGTLAKDGRRSGGGRGLWRTLHRSRRAPAGLVGGDTARRGLDFDVVRDHLGGGYRGFHGRQPVQGTQTLATVLTQQDLVRICWRTLRRGTGGDVRRGSASCVFRWLAPR